MVGVMVDAVEEGRGGKKGKAQLPPVNLIECRPSALLERCQVKWQYLLGGYIIRWAPASPSSLFTST